MMRVTPQFEPEGFDRSVRGPGRQLLMELRGDPRAGRRPGPKRKAVALVTADLLVDYWTRCLDDLAAAFEHVCAYSCVRIDPVTGARTVDHFRPKQNPKHHDIAYEWSNYRYACATMNSRKGCDEGVCDPFEVEEGWFELNLVTFGIKPAAWLNDEVRARVGHTIALLELDGQPMRDRREAAWLRYANDRTRAGWRRLEEDCPLVAREYRRQRGGPGRRRSKVARRAK